MNDVCFTGPSLVLLTAIWGVISGVIVTIFWLFVRSQDKAITRAQKKEDDATEIAFKAVRIGSVVADVVEEDLPRRRR